MTELFKKVSELKTPGHVIRYRNDAGEVKEALVKSPAEILPDTGREVIWVTGEQFAVDIKNVIL